MQPRLPYTAKLLYECANEACFYCGALLPTEDVAWKDFWNSEIGDLDFRAICPSCREPMMIWEDDDA